MSVERIVRAYKRRRTFRKKVRHWIQDEAWIEKKEYEKDEKYYHCVKDILDNPSFQMMSQFTQHGTTSTQAHCIQVSYLSYRIAKKLDLDFYTAARGGLLHDLFLYDWHTHKQETGNRFHGLTHPRVALKNAEREFLLSRAEKDMILHHMWPLTIIPPKTKEGYIIVYADKHCTLAEVGTRISKRLKKIENKRKRINKKKKNKISVYIVRNAVQGKI